MTAATDVLGIVIRFVGTIEVRLCEEFVGIQLLVLAVPHEDSEAMLSVSAVRTEEGVLGFVVDLELILGSNGEGGGVKSLKLAKRGTGLNGGEFGGDDNSDSLLK